MFQSHGRGVLPGNCVRHSRSSVLRPIRRFPHRIVTVVLRREVHINIAEVIRLEIHLAIIVLPHLHGGIYHQVRVWTLDIDIDTNLEHFRWPCVNCYKIPVE